MTMTDVLKIFTRRKRLAFSVFIVALAAGSVVALVKPLHYEAVIGIEKRPAQISLQPMAAEYDVTRYTSEDERTIAVLRSRFMMLEWLKAIGIPWDTPRQLEKQLKKLGERLVVKPVNFTDLYILRVEAESPPEAGRRAELIVKLFQNWDAAQAQSESEEVITLLQKRLESVRVDLAKRRTLVKRLKLSRTINLSGSTSESELDTDIKAKQNLYDGLTDELEKAERGTDPLSVHRVRILIPLTVSDRPTHTRLEYLLMILCASVLLAVIAVIFREWQCAPRTPTYETNRWIDRLPSSARTP